MPKNMPETHPEATSKKLVCGSCVWYRAGYKGITCQKTREVELETPACVEYQATKSDPFMLYARDKYILAIRAELRESSRLDLYEKMRKEVSSYLVDIDNINLGIGQHQNALALQTALQKIVGFRYRVSEVFTMMSDVQSDLDAMMEKTYTWLVSNYPEIRDLKNEKLKQTVVQRCVPELFDVINEVNKTVNVAKYIDQKLDKNDSTIQAMLKSVSSTYFSPSKVNGSGF